MTENKWRFFRKYRVHSEAERAPMERRMQPKCKKQEFKGMWGLKSQEKIWKDLLQDI